MGNTQRLQSEEPDMEFREDPLLYLRNIDRQMENEIGGQTRWGEAETNDRSRKQKKWPCYNDKGRNDMSGEFPYRSNRNYQRSIVAQNVE